MLEVRDLFAGYGVIQILRGVSLDVGRGEIVALLGSNGAGKSTLNNVLSRITPQTAGSVRFDGEDIHAASPARVVELGLIQVPEGRRIFPNLTVRENLELGSFRRGRARRAHNLGRVGAIFPRLAERWGQLAGSLSGGEQQMLAIGRGLMSEPKLLILDEPSLGLSPLLVETMFALIQRINQDGLSILLVEQNVVQSLAIADRGYVLENGAIALAGRASELVDNPSLKRSYFGI
jgi:branched-chain amino acid transport system ATP-binding protein